MFCGHAQLLILARCRLHCFLSRPAVCCEQALTQPMMRASSPDWTGGTWAFTHLQASISLVDCQRLDSSQDGYCIGRDSGLSHGIRRAYDHMHIAQGPAILGQQHLLLVQDPPDLCQSAQNRLWLSQGQVQSLWHLHSPKLHL